MSQLIRSLSDHESHTTNFSAQQNRIVLIGGLVCAIFSAITTIVTLRWFLLMKRTFRHTLIMCLIISDSAKSFWYLLFPIVVFTRGPVLSTSPFCQVAGFFLAFGIEAADFAILIIALHSILYIFNPPTRSNDDGGLYKWRKLLYPAWVIVPLLVASLGFVAGRDAYITAGTYCYLPRRPFWYRLALSWVPRYAIIFLIFAMYAAVYVYVTVKFRSFSNLQESDSDLSSISYSRRSSMLADDVAPDEIVEPRSPPKVSRIPRPERPAFSRKVSQNKDAGAPGDPWDQVSFITAKALRGTGPWQPGVEAPDLTSSGSRSGSIESISAGRARDMSTTLSAPGSSSRKISNSATINSQLTGDTVSIPHPQQPSATSHPPPPADSRKGQASQSAQRQPLSNTQAVYDDPLQRTRKAIRKQLRYLFVYPAVYVAMWIFPFASHCTQYKDHYIQNPVYWLTIMSTCMLALQAGVDACIFSWNERPWKRIPEKHKFSMQTIRGSFTARHGSVHDGSAMPSLSVTPKGALATVPQDWNGNGPGSTHRATSTNWWEAEGRRRKDSVWLGTDVEHIAGTAPARRGTVARIPSTSTVVEDEESDLDEVGVSRGLPHIQEEGIC